MAKVIYASLIVLLLISAATNASQEKGGQEVSYRVVGKKESDIFISYRFFNDSCSFWEHFRGKAYAGKIINTESFYGISSVGFSFEYPKPYVATKKFQGVESVSRYIGKGYVNIGGEKINVHRFYVENSSGSSRILISDSYVLPIGYDSNHIKVRITENGLKNLRTISCVSNP